MSKQPLSLTFYGLLARAVHNIHGRHFLTKATPPRHAFAHPRGPPYDRDPRSSGETLCTCDAPAPHKRGAVIETVLFAFKCMPWTPGHGLTGLSTTRPRKLQDSGLQTRRSNPRNGSGGELMKQWHDWQDRIGRQFHCFAQCELHQEENNFKRRLFSSRSDKHLVLEIWWSG